jgi:glutamine amidotransferase
MNGEKIVIVDYGLGNIHSICHALEECGADNFNVSDSPCQIKSADKIILPGVGSYKEGMDGLRSRGLVEPLVQHGYLNKPILGICLGMQLLATSGEEYGLHDGLNLIPGVIKKIPSIDNDKIKRKVPIVGWRNLNFQSNEFDPLFKEIRTDDEFYFVHSYSFCTNDSGAGNILASYESHGEKIVAAISLKLIYGLQFHPEKSGIAGLKIISNFVNLK